MTADPAATATTVGTRRRDPLARRVRAVPASGIRRFFDIINTMPDVISLGVGEPDFVTPLHIRQAGIRSLQEGRTSYTSNFGTIELRRAIAAYLERLYGVTYQPEREILVTAGVSEALDLAVRATIDPGDEVIIPEPSYVSYVPTVVFAGGTPVMVATTAAQGFAITARQVAAAITPRTKAVILGYPNNPTGTAVPRAELAAISRLAVEHDLLLFSDEIYGRLVYDGWEHTCLPSLPGAWERTVLLGGCSKSHAMTGWRIGYAAAPAELLEAMMKVHQYALLCAPTTAQDAAVEALEQGEADVAAMLDEYTRRRSMFVDGLNRIGVSCARPQGAFYAFPSIAVSGLSSQEFAEQLLFQEKVAVVPGSAFGPSGEGHVRMCYATAYEKLEQALERIARFVDRAAKTGPEGNVDGTSG
ncbi:MAG TPA: aminotransferase class I/II-fold pyridoxal phosphate-dependent enzyme [Chloroflexota bacterium]|nr:aminotransferase class I/II-fold pyridoxal phosphate-dependent enzyme [Chloroflexota bacterium]